LYIKKNRMRKKKGKKREEIRKDGKGGKDVKKKMMRSDLRGK